ncbi:MAG TPA: 2-oxoacid:acceptor oxidoreductase subunit alpha [Thermoanaerobaculia bacterium]|nr:2-oxoacid:acceptor oxidoreductase subunit alpha [Thermoanaerobaculia bacterium]
MSRRDLTIAMVGAGGDGIVTMGDILSQAGARDGLNVIKTEAYGPQIRGGESSCVVRLSPDAIYEQGDAVDVLVVFSWADFGRFKGEVLPAPGAVVLFDEADPVARTKEDLGLGASARWIAVPFAKIAGDAGAKGSKNVVGLGVLTSLLGLRQETIRRAVEKRFGRKKAAVGELALKAFEAGLAHGATLGKLEGRGIAFAPGPAKLIMSGNEAAALGALHAGCRFFAGYPITPSTEILQFAEEWLPKMGGTVVQTEDELAAIGAVVGASFAGVKSMTATSGPGLSLMTEMLGLASMAEIPCVIVDVQRGGPSTGLPTKSEQSDLWQAVFAGHGDAPRVVIAASDVEDCFHTTVEAFNISEEFQIPVVVLTDQSIGQRRETLDPARLVHPVRGRAVPTAEELADYKRYRDTPEGHSPMSVPGMKGGIYQTNGLEHDESGRPASMHLVHEKMNAKRYRKLAPIAEKFQRARRLGPAKADLGIVCWGSSKGAVKEALALAEARGEKVAAFIPEMISPFPVKALESFLASVGSVLVIEVSFAAQFAKYLRTFTTLPEDTIVFKRSGGKNLSISEVDDQIRRFFSPDRKQVPA